MLTNLLNIDMEFELAMLYGKKIKNLGSMKDEVFYRKKCMLLLVAWYPLFVLSHIIISIILIAYIIVLLHKLT